MLDGCLFYPQINKDIALSEPERPIWQEPISCFCSVRQVDIQVHTLNRMLVYRKAKSMFTTYVPYGWKKYFTATMQNIGML